MGTEHGRTGVALIEQLFEDPQKFDFFQAVRLLERFAQRETQRGEVPVRRSVGHDSLPGDESVRFRVSQSLAFPGCEIDRLTRSGDAGDLSKQSSPAEMQVTFMGLTGPSGVLPRHYTSIVMEQVRDKECAIGDFLDLFNHRIVSLFFRAWSKYRHAPGFESNRLSPQQDEELFTFALDCLVGMGTSGLRGRLAFDDDAFVFYGGHFTQFPRNAASLELMVEDLLKVSTRTVQWQGQWLYLEREDQTQLPAAGEPPVGKVQLGGGAIAGTRVWDTQCKFRIRLGPIDYGQFRGLMPSGDQLLPLSQFVRTYVGAEWDFDVQLVLRGPEVPWCRLGGDAFLGWNTWVRNFAFCEPVDQATFCLPDV